MEPCCGKQKVAISIILSQHKDWRHVPMLLYSAEDVPTRPDDSLAGERVLLLPWNDHFFQKKKKNPDVFQGTRVFYIHIEHVAKT